MWSKCSVTTAATILVCVLTVVESLTEARFHTVKHSTLTC